MIRNRYGTYNGIWFHYNSNSKLYAAKEVTFSRDFRGRYLNDFICRELCSDKIVVLYNLLGKNGDYYAIRVKLYPMRNKYDEKFVAVEKCGYVDNKPYKYKACNYKAVTVNTCANAMCEAVSHIYDEYIENDECDVTDITAYFKEILCNNLLNIPAMREYPEAIDIDTAVELLDNIADNIANGIAPSHENIWTIIRNNAIDWFEINFEDDGDACANGYSLKKPTRDDLSDINMKPKYRGEWNGVPVSFTRVYKDIYANDDECSRLCKNETVCINNIKFKLIRKKIDGIFRICMCPTGEH